MVHVHHGISRYKGLRHLSVQEFESDYLLLQFAGTDTLYVPLDRLNDIQRYRGADHQQPRLDRLGGSSWGRTKAKVKKSIEDMAHELLDLYANREVARRTVYSEDSLLTHEFEAAFDYEETPDQLKAIEDIQRDMESPKPMDRLVCGDVGYGKTEVAMRAAFKAVQDNRQVAVLVPTTLLAQQHYETFSVRFAPFPVRVGMLSRFQNTTDSKAICQDVASGTIDILIGTHRLLQKDVSFKNLGLVITDEEQWFGVRHKERLKQLRTQVDVLTLSATPIPRTLQMALSGVRDRDSIPFPVRVGMLSRFQNATDSKAICQDVASGTIDILIGTHRLLQKDVSFKNLGLVITDEEQWFGVRHKERLKQLRTQVDVLTLSATPIPRTLQMALSGVRDLSVIDTPPPGRLAIQTRGSTACLPDCAHRRTSGTLVGLNGRSRTSSGVMESQVLTGPVC